MVSKMEQNGLKFMAIFTLFVFCFGFISAYSAEVEDLKDDDAILGNLSASVTLIEFADYEGPFGGRFWEQTFPEIKSEYIETGKVNFVFRDFPLSSIHPHAQKAAEAAECIRDVSESDEVYFEMHDKLFENQQNLSDSNLKNLAEEIGYDISSCLDSGKFEEEVLEDSESAELVGARGTPYFLINNCQGISGAVPFENFEEVIESELNNPETSCVFEDEGSGEKFDVREEIEENSNEISNLKNEVEKLKNKVSELEKEIDRNSEEIKDVEEDVEDNGDLLGKVLKFLEDNFGSAWSLNSFVTSSISGSSSDVEEIENSDSNGVINLGKNVTEENTKMKLFFWK